MALIFKSSKIFSLLICLKIASSFQIHSIRRRNSRPIYVYKEKEFDGPRVAIYISQCTNIPSTHAGRVYSVNTANQCTRLYDTPNCSKSGKYIEVLPRSPCHNDLSRWKFGGRTLSAGPCPDKCSAEIIGNLTKSDVVTVQIFDRIDYKGAYRDITVNGCTPIPNRFFHDLLSIQTNNQCIQLYNTPTCNVTGSKVDTVELRRGTPFHNDIKFTWPFPTTKAISTCKYKCDMSLKDNEDGDDGSSFSELPGRGEIFLYHARYFEGTYLRVRASELANGCVNITDDWEGLVESVRVGNGTCVHLFDRRDCTGKSVVISGDMTDLGRDEFDGRTRSIKGCSERENSLERVGIAEMKQERGAGEEGGGSSSSVVITVIILVGVGAVGIAMVVWVVRENKNGGGRWGRRFREHFGRREGWSGFSNGGNVGDCETDGVIGENDEGDRDAFGGSSDHRGTMRNGNGFDLLA